MPLASRWFRTSRRSRTFRVGIFYGNGNLALEEQQRTVGIFEDMRFLKLSIKLFFPPVPPSNQSDIRDCLERIDPEHTLHHSASRPGRHSHHRRSMNGQPCKRRSQPHYHRSTYGKPGTFCQLPYLILVVRSQHIGLVARLVRLLKFRIYIWAWEQAGL